MCSGRLYVTCSCPFTRSLRFLHILYTYQILKYCIRTQIYTYIVCLLRVVYNIFKYSHLYNIYYILFVQMTVLDEALTVFDMTTKHWDVRSELVLYFKLAPVTLSGSAPTSAAAAAAGGRRA